MTDFGSLRVKDEINKTKRKLLPIWYCHLFWYRLWECTIKTLKSFIPYIFISKKINSCPSHVLLLLRMSVVSWFDGQFGKKWICKVVSWLQWLRQWLVY